jgi:hypothetical protein
MMRSAGLPNIHVLTGPIQSGKTTRLREWCAVRRAGAGRTRVDGILAPVVDGQRHLLHIASGEMRNLEDLSGGAPQIQVRRFTFNADVFAWARERLGEAARGSAPQSGRPDGEQGGEQGGAEGAEPEWIIVDEIGPLELRGEGLEPAVSGIVRGEVEPPGEIPRAGEDALTPRGIVLVIRTGLVEEALRHLGVDPAQAQAFEFPGGE